jgi:hypothetical protein
MTSQAEDCRVRPAQVFCDRSWQRNKEGRRSGGLAAQERHTEERYSNGATRKNDFRRAQHGRATFGDLRIGRVPWKGRREALREAWID